MADLSDVDKEGLSDSLIKVASPCCYYDTIFQYNNLSSYLSTIAKLKSKLKTPGKGTYKIMNLGDCNRFCT